MPSSSPSHADVAAPASTASPVDSLRARLDRMQAGTERRQGERRATPRPHSQDRRRPASDAKPAAHVPHAALERLAAYASGTKLSGSEKPQPLPAAVALPPAAPAVQLRAAMSPAAIATASPTPPPTSQPAPSLPAASSDTAASMPAAAPPPPVQQVAHPAAAPMPPQRSARPIAPQQQSAEPTQPAPSTSAPTPSIIPEVQDVSGHGELRRALEASKRALKAVGWFSCAINILMLTGPIFMLQVYDRVMTSGSYATLWVLLGLTTALYGVIGVLELIRSRVITRIGVEIDQRIGDRVFEASLRASLSGHSSSVGALRELDGLRQFVAGPAPTTAFDLAWTPIYLLVIFFTHWTLGLAALFGMVALLACAWASENRSRAPLMEAGKATMRSIELAETGQRNAGAITAMGMMGAYRARWQTLNQTALAWQVHASDRLGGLASVSKVLRLLMQSIMLAVGAALALHGDITAGAIIAGTIIFGRALAPVEQVITHWKASAKAIESYRHLEKLLASQPPRPVRTGLPKPRGHVQVEALRVAAPESKTVILAGLTCEIRPGRVLAVIGPSASGKSTFLRTLVGLWQPLSGAIRVDGQKLDQWDPEELGRHVGFLPQDVELFAGTVRDNIARFRADASDDAVVAAAKAAHAHDLILGLAKGYDTELGAYGAYLSAGQRQRIGLARALFGTPALVVMDEPNANLDRAGDEALAAAIDGMRKRGQAVVLVSHRVQAIGIADDILYLERGQQRAFGPRDEVMKALNAQAAASAPPATPTPPARR